jgi:hypothetical protein
MCAEGLVLGRTARQPDAGSQADPVVLGCELDILLSSPGYRMRAREIADEIAAQPSPARVVRAIEALG